MPNSYENLYNFTAERYVLGSILINNSVMSAVHGKLNMEDFYNEDSQKVYHAMTNLFKGEQPIDILLVVEELKRLRYTLSMDAKEYLLGLVDDVPTTATTDLYINIVKEKAVERELQRNLTEINNDILSSRLEYNDLLDKAEDKILAIIKKRRSSELLSIDKAATQVYDLIKRYTMDDTTVVGVPSGFPFLDRETLGFRKGDLVILAARPSVGKSALALNFAVNACQKKKGACIAFFSLEMSIEQLMIRLYSYEAHISASKIQKGQLNDQEMILLGRARQTLSSYNIFFDESNSSNIYDIRNKCRQLKQRGQLDMVIIDYLQLITTDAKGSRQEEVAMISRSLKVLAKELEVPVIALSQLSRLAEQHEETGPLLSDLRESGSIEQDADIVLFLYRPKENESGSKEYEVVDASVPNEEDKERLITLNIAKNRQGGLNMINYNFFPAECRFREVKHATREKRKAAKAIED